MKRLLLWFALLLFSAACIAMVTNVILTAARDHARRRGTAAVRSDRAVLLLKGEGEHRERDIVVGLAGPRGKTSYESMAQGAALAVSEINEQGGILNHKFKLDIRDDLSSVAQARHVAQEFAVNLDTIAVIGHPDSEIALTTAIIYEYYGLLFITPTATVPSLTQEGYRRVIRNIPNDDQIGTALADFSLQQGFSNILIFYSRNHYGRELANAFENVAVPLGINIIDRRAYDSTTTERQYREVMENWKRHFEFDAILLAGSNPEAGEFIRAARDQGIDVPILAGAELDTPELGRQIGASARNVYVATVFSAEKILNAPEDTNPLARTFIRDYQNRFHTIPDYHAAQGYDAIKLLATTMKTTASFDPVVLSEQIHMSKSWLGVTGTHTFDEKGDVLGKEIDIIPYPVPAGTAAEDLTTSNTL